MGEKYRFISMSHSNNFSNGQSVMEFYVISSMILGVLFLGIFFTLVAFNQANVNSNQMEAEKVCFIVSDSINSAFLSGLGFNRTATIPSYLNGNNYSVRIDAQNYRVTVSWPKNDLSCRIYTQDVWNNTNTSSPSASQFFNIKIGNDKIFYYRQWVVYEPA